MPQHSVDVPDLPPVPRLSVDRILRRTGKSLLAAGIYADQPAVVKLLLDNDAEWVSRWRHEIDAYRVFSQQPPPVRTPKLLHTDGERLLILEHLDGQVLDHVRYPQAAPSPEVVRTIVTTLSRNNGWHPPSGAFGKIFDYPARVERYRTAGYLDDTDANNLWALLARCADTGEFNHGDPLPSNILLPADGTCALLDWEFAGLFLPGFDLAMLHTLLSAAPTAQQIIDATVDDAGIEDPFTVNLAMVLTRELRIHRELPEGPLRQQRLPPIEAAWHQARRRLHATARSS